MAKFPFVTTLVASLAVTSTIALQVSPNSQCASVCIDQAEQDKSDPNVSNTLGSDIVCHDDNYGTTVGQKFKGCLDCLQNSSDKSTAESDLQWFFYNLRYAVNSCLFGLHNATDPLSSPCSIQTSCGPLVASLQDGMEEPRASNRYSYCEAFGGSFLGNRLAPCTKCLRLTDEQKYMSNFMIALKAGCDQRPEIGKLVGLDGSLFSRYPVNATSVATPQPTTAPGGQTREGLTTGAYAGIGIAIAFVLAILVAVCIVGKKKKDARTRRDQIASGLDDRYGNGRITIPVKGGYGDPYPPKSSPFHDVGLVSVPEKPYATQRDSYHSQYIPGHHRPLSTVSHHTLQNMRGVGAAPAYPPYDPSRVDRHNQNYSPALSQDTSQNSPKSIANSTTRLHRPSLSLDASSYSKADASPMVGTGLPKTSTLPKRTPSDAAASTYAPRPARLTRDLSLPRDQESSISGPIVSVETRCDTDEDARKRAERQRLFEKGFQPRASRIEEGPSPDGELWPGKY